MLEIYVKDDMVTVVVVIVVVTVTVTVIGLVIMMTTKVIAKMKYRHSMKYI